MALHIRVQEQKWNFAKRLVELGADVNEVDVNGLSVLHVIATQKIDNDKDDCIEFINLLLIKGANVTGRSPKGDSVFHLAARHDNWEIMERILTQATDGIEHIDEPDSEGFTILHRLAIKKNRGGRNISLIQFLLDNGAKCDTLCPSGDTAMHLAVKNGNWGILHELLCYHIGKQSISTDTNKQWLSPCIALNQYGEKRGVNVDIKDAFGNTVLHLCAKAEAWYQVNTLLKCGADASLTDDEGDTVLNRLFNARNVYTAETEEFFDTIIQIVARNKNVTFFDKLLDHLDDVDMTDSDGLTILHRVVQCSSSWSLDIVRTLMKREVDIKLPDPKGDTALHFAARCGRWDIVRELLDNGAIADKTDSQGVSVLHRLLSSLFPRLCQNGTYNSNEKNLSLVKLMDSSGLDTNTKHQYTITVLELALDEREWEVILFFFESKAEMTCQLIKKKGKSLFHELAMDTSVDVKTVRSLTKHLLAHGFDLNKHEPHDETPLYLAAYHGNWTVVQVFLEYGADASIPDNEGWYVCHRLCRNKNDVYPSGINLLTILSLLKGKGFQVNQRRRDGKSCVQMSIECRKFELFWWLVEHGVAYSLDLNEKKIILENMHLFISENTDQNKLRYLIMRFFDKENFRQELTECTNKALKTSVLNRKWVVAKTLVECGAKVEHLEGQPLLHFLISKYKKSDHETWLSFLDTLLARGADINCRDGAGRTILFQRWNDLIALYGKEGSDSLLHALVDRGASPLLADAKGTSLLRYALDLEESLALISIKFLIQVGMSTYQPALTETASKRSPTQRAFEKKYDRVFRMLVESGASCNRELFKLSTRYQVKLSTRDKTTAETQMLDILNHAASQPRSLESLCRLTVSHALGCGPHRMDRAKSLPLPVALHDYVQFSELLRFC